MSIKIKLTGGLGNQMFQFANGYTIAKKKNAKLYLDLSWFNRRILHNGFELDHVFNVYSKVIFLKKNFSLKKLNLSNFLNELNFTYYKYNEPHYHYSAKINQIPNHCFLKGYWQSELYFKEYTDDIKKIFCFKNIEDQENILIKNKIINNNSVSVHIRRGDFLLERNKIHQINLKKYYSESIKKILEFNNNPFFFIFSDDPIWVSKNFIINSKHIFVKNNKGNNSYLDMKLMSLCKTNIISNSTFSWWAAWLNINENKKIYAPKNWFNDKSISTDDLIPSTWIRI